MSTYHNEMIYKFEEKPKSTDSTKASMGVYIFSTAKLIKYLEEDEANPESENDFGKNVIPAMLKNGERMFAYPFEGYWKDERSTHSGKRIWTFSEKIRSSTCATSDGASAQETTPIRLISRATAQK